MIFIFLNITAFLLLLCVISILVYIIRSDNLAIVEAEGFSMHPNISNGDVLIGSALPVDLTFLEPGEVYVFAQDIEGDDGSKETLFLIKRLAFQNDSGCFFVGDNAEDSIDSRSFGFVPVENVHYKIINLNGGEGLWRTILLRCVLGVAVAFKLYQRL